MTNHGAIGGGPGYDHEAYQKAFSNFSGNYVKNRVRHNRTTADVIVKSRDQLLDAVEEVNDYDSRVIYVEDSAEIELKPEDCPVVISRDWGHIVSGRDVKGGNAGGVIHVPAKVEAGLKFTGVSSRLSGIRVLGPAVEANPWEGYDHEDPTVGALLEANRTEVDNCEIRGFDNAAVASGRGGAVNWVHVHHNDLCDNPSDGLGYGMKVYHGHALIDRNYFDNNRHSIAGDGYEDCSYEAYCNIQGPQTTQHCFDMHAAAENSTWGGRQGGKSFVISNNIFMATQAYTDGDHEEAVKIRGAPIEQSEISNNVFANVDEGGPGGRGKAIQIPSEYESFEDANILVDGNVYGMYDPGKTVGIPTSTV
ncbi:hypothetical protein ACFQL7_20795 [Halocatena marina]|uniref:Right handed beta helix domain-containing protein n=1 Tax=Halocatena marina TaxID=2934937 RepID=A0ABD5YSU9_9EURY|nr:hypothetical protein [Halocatena marina]